MKNFLDLKQQKRERCLFALPLKVNIAAEYTYEEGAADYVTDSNGN
jgi:hypothetical protein